MVSAGAISFPREAAKESVGHMGTVILFPTNLHSQIYLFSSLGCQGLKIQECPAVPKLRTNLYPNLCWQNHHKQPSQRFQRNSCKVF